MFGINTYVLWDPESLEAAIVDPGMISPEEEQAISGFITRNGLHPVHLLNTHMHLDHIFGNIFIKEKYGLEIKAHPEDDFLGRSLRKACGGLIFTCRHPTMVLISPSLMARP